MDLDRARMVKALRLHVHDPVVRYADAIDDIGDRLDFTAADEAILARQDQDSLMDLALLLRGVAGEAKVSLGYVLEDQSEYLSEAEVRRLRDAFDWLRLAELSFRSVPAEVEMVRARRQGSVAKLGLSPQVRAMLSAYVLDEDTDEPTAKELDDGDIFDTMRAGLRGLRRAWDKMAAAMVHAPAGQKPPEGEMVEAFAADGLTLRAGEVTAVLEAPRRFEVLQARRELATENKRRRPKRARRNHGASFGWPAAAE